MMQNQSQGHPQIMKIHREGGNIGGEWGEQCWVTLKGGAVLGDTGGECRRVLGGESEGGNAGEHW